ncbi:2-hydroxyacyl-CoA dehydratase [Bacillus sp. AGMB 02131]|uniref:2-hydroxyacyl-CoA dehydratase n=1 Tax=Peribacillus faecalis TaxID=2772559 RepID=A0A927CYQ1_9BACI|nr:2-hydroxyacyl-CoA dehydratase [Peribacillus faecalis]MBD3107774.1 2-hydroxyacyl-CoA dehydratase [Peribacillus faecalis]
MLFHIGLDVGSTTSKLVVLNEQNETVFQKYCRHFSDVKNTTIQMLKEVYMKFPNARATMNITGSAGMAMANYVDLPFVQEVICCTEAVERFIPETDVVVELGGEDAKLIYLQNGIEQRMNTACAGGTGAFIDQIATLMQTDAEGLNHLAENHEKIYPIASRCGVFAKTDVQPLLNEGARKEDISASVFQSVVTQTISGLACGRPIRGKVAFLGGPLTYLSELRQRFIETLNLTDEEIIFPENSQYFVAYGAAFNSGKCEVVSLAQLCERFETFSRCVSENDISTLPRLFAGEHDLQSFRERHNRAKIERGNLATYKGEAFLGIDAGSTTTKIVLIGAEHDELLFTFYENNNGQPLQSVINGLELLYKQMPNDVQIAHSAITGYGEGLVKTALKIDIGEIETVAHYKAAKKFSPNVDFILDIGGQDMKCIKIKNGAIDHLMLNEACSAGCGSFLESFAKSLNLTIEEFALAALTADMPVDLGSRCTVFMNSKVKQVQKEGVTLSNLSAGLSYSVIKNAIQKVMKLRNTDELGDNIIVQGGTFYNEAVLRAFELLIGKEVVRPDIAGMMGAYGCALIAKEKYENNESEIVNVNELQNFTCNVSHSRCGLCGNNCPLTINRFKDKRFFITGNRCERGAGRGRKKNKLPNLYTYKYDRIFGYQSLSSQQATRGRVGLPRVLNMYENYPFWHTFFTYLGYEVVLSPKSSKKLYEKGMDSIPSDSACYPAKLTHGHIQALVEQDVDFIFYPSVVFEKKENEESTNHYNCPIVTSYPEVIRVNMDILKEKQIPFIQPFLTLDNEKALIKELSEQFLEIPKKKIAEAVHAACLESNQVKMDIREKGEETLRYLKDNGIKGIVLAGRPYHIDPEINHGISELITAYGMAVLTEDSIAHLAPSVKDPRVVNQWTYHSRLYRAARVVAKTEELELVQLTSFGCGLDAVTSDMVQEILEENQKMYTVIKIDEINNLGAARIRIRSLKAAMEERNKKTIKTEKQVSKPKQNRLFTKEMKKDYTILIPQMSPIHFDLYEAVLKSEGYKAELLPTVPHGAVNEGLRYVNNDACYPAVLTIGQIVHALKSGNYDVNRTAVIMSQTGGACRATNYISLLRRALKDAGMEQIPVISLNALGMEKHPGFEISYKFLRKLIAATVYGDALMRMTYQIRPYECRKGRADYLCTKWSILCKKSLANFRWKEYVQNIKTMVEEFDNVPIHVMKKPRVGIVGEILVKFHPDANNQIVQLIEQEGGEAVMPDILDFFLYCTFDSVYKGNHLGKSKWGIPAGHTIIRYLEHFRKPLKAAYKKSERFTPPHTIYELADLSSSLISVANQAGEGWFLTGEMMGLIEAGVHNIACVQPFACLPNHVTGRGMMKGLKQIYPHANIAAIDYDASESAVNQVNRLKLMMATAFKNMERYEIYNEIDTAPNTNLLNELVSESPLRN